MRHCDAWPHDTCNISIRPEFCGQACRLLLTCCADKFLLSLTLPHIVCFQGTVGCFLCDKDSLVIVRGRKKSAATLYCCCWFGALRRW